MFSFESNIYDISVKRRCAIRCAQSVGAEVEASEQSIFAEVGIGARILIQVELEQRYSMIAPSSRSSHILIAFLYHCF